jgi:hypothetical protein
MGRLRLSASPPTVSDVQGVRSRTRLRRVLPEGGGSKLGFGDENPEINLCLDSSPSAHVPCFLLEGLA